MNNTPNPGSDEAINKGCICPVMDNFHGQGYRGMKEIFVMNLDCPLHGQTTEKAPEASNDCNSQSSSGVDGREG